jgi:hypothetical protein
VKCQRCKQLFQRTSYNQKKCQPCQEIFRKGLSLTMTWDYPRHPDVLQWFRRPIGVSNES